MDVEIFWKDESQFANLGLIESQVSTAYLIFNDYKVETSTENVSSATEFHKTRVFLNEISSLKSTSLFGQKNLQFFYSAIYCGK